MNVNNSILLSGKFWEGQGMLFAMRIWKKIVFAIRPGEYETQPRIWSFSAIFSKGLQYDCKPVLAQNDYSHMLLVMEAPLSQFPMSVWMLFTTNIEQGSIVYRPMLAMDMSEHLLCLEFWGRLYPCDGDGENKVNSLAIWLVLSWTWTGVLKAECIYSSN